MCLGVPGLIIETFDKSGLKMARVDFGGVKREVCLDYVPESRVGDYCIVHVGFAISLLSEAEAQRNPCAAPGHRRYGISAWALIGRATCLIWRSREEAPLPVRELLPPGNHNEIRI